MAKVMAKGKVSKKYHRHISKGLTTKHGGKCKSYSRTYCLLNGLVE